MQANAFKIVRHELFSFQSKRIHDCIEISLSAVDEISQLGSWYDDMT